jgi:protein involved in ribonucleotide reduction
MRPIPPKLKEDMANDAYYKKCCIADWNCNGNIEWHHNFIYAGRQQNHKWCILPLCHTHHMKAENKQIKSELDMIMISRATPEELAEYPKRKWN